MRCIAFMLATFCAALVNGAESVSTFPATVGLLVYPTPEGAYYLSAGLISFDKDTGEAVSTKPIYAYDKSGGLRSVINFDRDGRRSGLTLALDEQGRLIKLFTYKENKLNGAWMDFDLLSGALIEQRKYQDGGQVGRSVIYDKEGMAHEGPTEEERSKKLKY